jgi:hypothetical protein
MLESCLVPEIAVKNGLGSSCRGSYVFHGGVAAEGLHSFPGGLDQFASAFFPMGLPARSTAVDGGATGGRRKFNVENVHDTQRIRYAGYR